MVEKKVNKNTWKVQHVAFQLKWITAIAAILIATIALFFFAIQLKENIIKEWIYVVALALAIPCASDASMKNNKKTEQK